MSRFRASMLVGHRDRNEPEIVAALEARGCLVVGIQAKGVPDLIVWSPFLKQLVLLEVKDGENVLSKKRLKPEQEAFHKTWRAVGAPVFKVTNRFEALKAVGCPPEQVRKGAKL